MSKMGKKIKERGQGKKEGKRLKKREQENMERKLCKWEGRRG